MRAGQATTPVLFRGRLRPTDWLFLFFILLGCPTLSWFLFPSGLSALDTLAEIPRSHIYLQSMAITWSICFLLIAVLRFRRSALIALGFRQINFTEVLWGILLFAGANVVLLLTERMLPSSAIGTDDFLRELLPRTTGERMLWLGLSLTAAVGEETIFRGYVLTRLYRAFGGWPLAVVFSSLGFGLAHLYQGWAGILLTGVYGVLFSLVYIRRRSLWPCVIAHFLQDAIVMLPVGFPVG